MREATQNPGLEASNLPPPDPPQARLLIDPMTNVLIGSQLIRMYLGIKSIVTMIEWVEVYGLPCVKRPDGQWMTTMSAIDEWIFMAAEADYLNRPYSRGDNKRADQALKKAQNRVDRMRTTRDRKQGTIRVGDEDGSR